MKFRSVASITDLAGKRVLVRADFNVPIKKGEVQDAFKIERTVPTLRYLLQKGAQVIVVSHLGRPKEKEASLSLRPVARALEKRLGQNIYFTTLEQASKRLPPRAVIMLENIRFNRGEENNALALAKQLAVLADIFVLDGFGVAHRNAASVSGVARYLPAYAGLLFEKEVTSLYRVMKKPQKPFVLILGGQKMETKIPILKKLLPQADYVLVGGGIANTYWWAQGKKVGDSLIDQRFKKDILAYGKKKKMIFPIDVVVGARNGSQARVMKMDKHFAVKGKQEGIYDIGPATVLLFARYLKQAKTIVWNGAMGYFEQPPYQHGSYSTARLIAARSKGKAFGVCGGGETMAILGKLGVMDEIDLPSTGGGAMLEFLAGKQLSGIKALQ